MAERRMFAKTIIDSDAFLDMPLSAQALYFHLSMRADDDGFINNPRKIQRIIGCGNDDLKLLFAKNFVIPFESGIVVIKHWKIHNYIQKDRYKPTMYQEEKALLNFKVNKAYTLKTPEELVQNSPDTKCIHDVSKPDTQSSLELDKSSLELELELEVEGGMEGDFEEPAPPLPAPPPVSPEKKKGKRKSSKPETVTEEIEAEQLNRLPASLREDMSQWLQYKNQRREEYTPVGLTALISETINNADKYGEGAVAQVIRTSMASGYKGIVFDRLQQQNGKGRKEVTPGWVNKPSQWEKDAVNRMMEQEGATLEDPELRERAKRLKQELTGQTAPDGD